TDQLTGFDIDLGNAIADEMGVELSWEQVDYNQFLTSLETGRVNMVMGGMGDTEERQSQATFVDYLQTGTQLYTSLEAQQQHAIKELTDLCGETVAASENSNYSIFIDAWSEENCQGKGQPAIKVLDTDGSPAARLQLEQGRAVAVAQTTETVSYQLKVEPDTYALLGEPIDTEFYGIGFAPEDEERQTEVREALATLIENGTYADIVKKWDLEGQEIEEPTVNLEPVDQ
ncbi:MAG: transporter substrate-binding domain-containing protein, partial [Nocardioidaceae bacterium]